VAKVNSLLKIRLDKTLKGGEFLRGKRCNLNCPWCHGDYFYHKEGLRALDNKEIVECVKKVILASERPRVEIKISGQGEPCLVGKEELGDLIRRLKRLPKVENLKLVTNGTILAEMANDLYRSGLDGCNVSIHTLNPEKYKMITGRKILYKAMEGLTLAKKVGLKVKVNTIYSRFNEEEVGDYVDLALRKRITIKFFRLLPHGSCESFYLPIENLVEQLNQLLFKKNKRRQRFLLEYLLDNSGTKIQVKNSKINYCLNRYCPSRSACLETCRYSVRISQDGDLHPCGVRLDNIISLISPRTRLEDIKKALRSGGKF